MTGNLAFAESWYRLSETEADLATAPHVIRVCSTSANAIQWPATRHILSPSFPGLFTTRQLNLFGDESSDIMAVVPSGTLFLEQKGLYKNEGDPWSRIQSTLFIVGSVAHQTFLESMALIPTSYDWDALSGIISNTFPTAGRLDLRCFNFWAVTKGLGSSDQPEALRVQVQELHDEVAMWPGSYNQLLLAGSLDYCVSALTKLKRSPAAVQMHVSSAIKRYYDLCAGIAEQYGETKSSLRRINLQSLQDKFDLLQETCAEAQVYPRLKDLDPMDIPLD